MRGCRAFAFHMHTIFDAYKRMSRCSCTELDAPFGRPDAIKNLAEGENGGQDSADASQQKEEDAAQSTAGVEPAPQKSSVVD